MEDDFCVFSTEVGRRELAVDDVNGLVLEVDLAGRRYVTCDFRYALAVIRCIRKRQVACCIEIDCRGSIGDDGFLGIDGAGAVNGFIAAGDGNGRSLQVGLR